MRQFWAKESQRGWLTFPAERAKQPLIWELSRNFDAAFNIRSANTTAEAGIIALELTGERKAMLAAVKWRRKKGIEVNPVELDVIEG